MSLFRDDFEGDLSQWNERSGTWSILGAPPERYVGFRCNGETWVTPTYCVNVANSYSSLMQATAYPAYAGGLCLIQQNKCLYLDSTVNASLTTFDNAGIKVFIQPSATTPEVANQYQASGYVGKAAVPYLIDGALSNYGSHPCVLGVGVDLEMLGVTWDTYVSVSNAEAASWRTRIQNYNPNFRMYLKHWMTSLLPSTERNNIVFVDMAQNLGSLNNLISNFQSWANFVSPANVAFQVGYCPDRSWWQNLTSPPRYIANAIFQAIPTALGVYWHTQSIRDNILSWGDWACASIAKQGHCIVC